LISQPINLEKDFGLVTIPLVLAKWVFSNIMAHCKIRILLGLILMAFLPGIIEAQGNELLF
jgi:hypothetical protein